MAWRCLRPQAEPHGTCNRAVSPPQTVTPEAKAAPKHVDSAPAVQPVVILEKPNPVYTEEARKLGLEGEVLVEVIFPASGQVQVVRVVKGLGHGLDEAALRAAEQIRFKPALQEGQAGGFPGHRSHRISTCILSVGEALCASGKCCWAVLILGRRAAARELRRRRAGPSGGPHRDARKGGDADAPPIFASGGDVHPDDAAGSQARFACRPATSISWAKPNWPRASISTLSPSESTAPLSTR